MLWLLLKRKLRKWTGDCPVMVSHYCYRPHRFIHKGQKQTVRKAAGLSAWQTNYFYNDMDKPVKWRGASDSTWSKVKPASRDNKQLWPQDGRNLKDVANRQWEMLFEMKRGRSVSLHCASSAFLACPAGTALAPFIYCFNLLFVRGSQSEET